MRKQQHKIKFFSLLIISLLFSFNLFAGYFNDDKEYTDIILSNRVWGDNWKVEPEKQIPKELKKYSVTETEILDSKTNTKVKNILVPQNLLQFNEDGTFVFLWQQKKNTAAEIGGKWKVENSALILSLQKNIEKPYKKGSELRYKIIGKTNNDIHLKLKGTQYSPVTNIIKSTNNPIVDMEKIAIAVEQTKLNDNLADK